MIWWKLCKPPLVREASKEEQSQAGRSRVGGEAGEASRVGGEASMVVTVSLIKRVIRRVNYEHNVLYTHTPIRHAEHM